jgi:hypothetical protein
MNQPLEPWILLNDERRQAVERQLVRELPAGHVIAGKSKRAVATRTDRDDVLFELFDGGYAVVHLSWSGRTQKDTQWPATQLFASLEEWRERRMLPDHHAYAAS